MKKKTSGRWGERKREIVRMLVKNPRLLEWEIAEVLGISQPAVNKHIAQLKALGVVRVEKRRPRYVVAFDRGAPVIRTAGSV